MPEATLLDVLRHLELSGADALLRFRDGDAYRMRIISTLHAEEGDDIVAEVLSVVSASTGAGVPAGAFMNFRTPDVAEVFAGGGQLFPSAGW